MAGSHSSDSLCGTVLHETYRLARVIGRGGMGTVYEAVHTRLHKKRFALKVLQLAAARSPELFARFRREAEIATELGHPNIVEVVDFNCTAEGQPYIVMELLEGENLRRRIERERTLTPRDLLQVMEPVCDALQAVHAIGVVHRDMKPENIFLVRGHQGAQQVKVLDFGISKIQHDSSVVTQLHAIFGTPHYMSPEQASGAGDRIDSTTDTFALGTICYVALSGAWPFDGATALEIRHNVCHGQPRPLTALVPELSKDFDRVLARALAKEQRERYQHASDFLGALRAALERSQTRTGVAPLQSMPDTPTARNPPAAEPEEPSTLPPRTTWPAAGPEPEEPSLETTTLPGEPDHPFPAGLASAGLHRDLGTPRPETGVVVGTAPADEPGTATALPGSSGDPLIGLRAGRTTTTLSGAAGEAERGRATRRRRGSYLLLVVGCVAALAAGFLVVWIGMRAASVRPTRPDTPPRRGAGPARPMPPTPKIEQLQAADAAVRSHVRIRLELEPGNAQVLLDGQLRRENPLVLELSGATHRLRIEAPGHEPVEHTFAADANRSILVKLAQSRRRWPGGKAAPRGRGRLVDKPTGDWEDPYPSAPGAGVRDDDWDDPYARKRRPKAPIAD